MRAKFIFKYSRNNTVPKCTLLPEDYQQVPDQIYAVEYDDNRIVCHFKEGDVIGRAVDNVNKRWSMGLSTNWPVRKYYAINEDWAGGRIIIYNNNYVEYTVYGSGLPILSSQIGKMLMVDA